MVIFIKKLLSNSIFTFVIATLLAIGLYILSQDNIEVSYAVSKPEIIASNSKNAPELTFHWKNKKIEKNLYRINVIFWNSGNRYIDFNQISKTHNIKLLINDDKHQIISSNISKKVNEQLNIITNLKKEENNYIIDCILKDDNSLEINDGFIVSIFYTGEKRITVNALGKIKGMQGKIKDANWNDIKVRSTDKTTIFIFLCILLLVGITLKCSRTESCKTNKILNAIFLNFLSPILSIIFIGASIGFIIVLIKPYIFGLTWIN